MNTLFSICFRIAHRAYRYSRAAIYPLLIRGRSRQVYHSLPDVIRLLDEGDVRYWLGGGIAYDLMRGQQTRPHKDIDLSVFEEEIEQVRTLFESAGYGWHHSRNNYYMALRGSLKIDIFAWRLVGSYRQQVYDHSMARVDAKLFNQNNLFKLGEQQVCVTPSAMMIAFLPLVKDPADRAYLQQLPMAPGYQLTHRQREVRVTLPCDTIEAARHAASTVELSWNAAQVVHHSSLHE